MRVTLPFGEWLPDQPTLGLQGATVATNVLPDANAYRPMPSLVPFSTAIGSRALGGIIATDAASSNYNYVGDASAIYSLTQQSFSAVTRAGGAYTTLGDDVWEFANWGNTVIGVNGKTDLPQQISLGAATFADMSVGVKASHICALRDFIVLGNVSDSATQVYRVRWSALNNPLDFAPSAATLSDYQDLPSEGGPVQKLVGGEYGVVFQRASIWRMLFIGSPVIFQFDHIHKSIGAFAPGAVAVYQNLIFFLSAEGFYSLENATTLTPIGRGKVDKFFFSDLHASYTQRISAAIDPVNKLVVWAYASNSTTGGNADKLLVYSWAYNKWSLVSGVDVELVLSSISTGYTLEGLDAITTNLDALPVTLDSVQWTGGQVILSAYNSTHKLGRFNGSAMPATITTGEQELIAAQRAYITEVRPVAIGLSANIAVSVLNRNNLTESVSTGAANVALNATGFAPVRVTSRYFNVQLSLTSDFKQLLGVEVTGTAAGER